MSSAWRRWSLFLLFFLLSFMNQISIFCSTNSSSRSNLIQLSIRLAYIYAITHYFIKLDLSTSFTLNEYQITKTLRKMNEWIKQQKQQSRQALLSSQEWNQLKTDQLNSYKMKMKNWIQNWQRKRKITAYYELILRHCYWFKVIWNSATTKTRNTDYMTMYKSLSFQWIFTLLQHIKDIRSRAKPVSKLALKLKITNWIVALIMKMMFSY